MNNTNNWYFTYSSLQDTYVWWWWRPPHDITRFTIILMALHIIIVIYNPQKISEWSKIYSYRQENKGETYLLLQAIISSLSPSSVNYENSSEHIYSKIQTKRMNIHSSKSFDNGALLLLAKKRMDEGRRCCCDFVRCWDLWNAHILTFKRDQFMQNSWWWTCRWYDSGSHNIVEPEYIKILIIWTPSSQVKVRQNAKDNRSRHHKWNGLKKCLTAA